ncbi:MAG: U32 family peptidase [Clostridiaceae bacterium]|nr:U32 family peptidase [Clostridiaceae bacterium]
MNNIELLAPAGSFEALKAAVQNGADAIYLGGMLFSARAYASNFDEEILEKAVEYAHIRGVKVYVTVNTLIKDMEIIHLLPYLKFLYEIGIDAVILQDLGVVKIVKDIFPDFPIHCSTQMTLHNSQGVEVLKKAGVERTVLARELSLKEIKAIYQSTGMELEVFVHGALCYGYSGQCLMSSFIGGRSGNRGRCAQPCRKQYELVSLDEGSTHQEKAFYISMRDLNTLEDIGKIIESGVTSFKIEGRMKKPQYVAAIVKAYRKAIDQYIKAKTKLVDEEIHKEVTQVFNRKFTKGYILNSHKDQILNIQKPNNRGLLLGVVEEYNNHNKTFTLQLLDDIQQGDGIEVANQAEGIGGIANKIYKNNKLTHEAKKGEKVEIKLIGRIEKGAKVYKTLDMQLMKRLEVTYNYHEENKKVNIYGEVTLKVNEPMELCVWDEDGNTVCRKSDVLVEQARKVALSEEKVSESMKKLGNTPFEMHYVNCHVEQDISIPIAIVNRLRRDTVEDLIKVRKNKSKRSFQNTVQMNLFIEDLSSKKMKANDSNLTPKISVKVDTINQLDAVLTERVDRIYYGNLKNLDRAVELCRHKKVQIFFRCPSIIKDHELQLLQDKVKDFSLDGVLAGDLAMVQFTKEHLNIPVIGDMSLNTMNSKAIAFLKELGADGITLSPELDLRNIKGIQGQEKSFVEIIIYGKLLAMVAETCPLIESNQCNHPCEKCRKSPYTYQWGLKDDKNISFPFSKDYLGRTIILNSKPIYMLDKMQDIYTTNIKNYRLEFTDESPEDVVKVTKAYVTSIKNSIDNNNIVESNSVGIDEFTRGHFYRGVD